MSSDLELTAGRENKVWWANHRSVANMLKAVGIKNTSRRRWILIKMGKVGFPTRPSDLHRMLKAKRIDLVTFYRVLALMEAKGLVHKTYLHDGSVSYSISKSDQRDYFITSPGNRKAVALPAELAQETQAAVEAVQRKLAELGYTEVGHNLVFRGRVGRIQHSELAEHTPARFMTSEFKVEIPAEHEKEPSHISFPELQGAAARTGSGC